jgi:(2Fe-2S) ferredoxin
LREAVRAAGLNDRVRVNKSGCLDQCEHGPNLVVYPEAVWYGHVSPDDAEEIVQSHLIEGRPVQRLMLADECIHTPSCEHKPVKQ